MPITCDKYNFILFFNIKLSAHATSPDYIPVSICPDCLPPNIKSCGLFEIGGGKWNDNLTNIIDIF